MVRRRAALGGVVAAFVVLFAWPAPASADLSDPPGACVVTMTWGEGGVTVDSAMLDPADVVEVDRADEVTWTSRVNGPVEGTVRPVAGSVSLVLPVPFGNLTLDEWSGSTGEVVTSGTGAVPELLPAGVVFDMRMEHYENGELFCTAVVRLRIGGGPGPIAWGALVATLLVGASLALLGVKGNCSFGMRLLGAGLGLLAGALVGSDLVLFGVLPLASIGPVLLAVAGLVTGTLVCRFRRLLRRKKSDERDSREGESKRLVGGPA